MDAAVAGATAKRSALAPLLRAGGAEQEMQHGAELPPVEFGSPRALGALDLELNAWSLL